MILKNQLKLFLEHKELSATQLSKRSGVSKQVISLWLAGGSPRKLEQIKSVAETLDTTIDHLCFGSGLHSQSDEPQLTGTDWFSGIFEMKIRRLK
ncbi:helix-turn-helix domain-containing protein [Bdellovibrio sp. HCB117]|uniref:helix-turn-helix domain-containing protein n=1 Tax=Bdellovibrio sp. HCB117 TaxID=3394359 RepID=UPI0039B4254A